MKPYYEDGLVRLFLGDCREITDWLNADVLVCDPPYGTDWKRHGGGTLANGRGIGRHNGIANDLDTTVRDAACHMWGDRPGVLFGSFYAPPPARLTHVAVWRMPSNAGVMGATTGFRRDVTPIYLTGPWPLRPVLWSSVLTSAATAGSPNSPQKRYGHPHAKPVDLMEALTAVCPTGVIADPFAGGGSTLIAARNQGRKAIGVELDESYCEGIAKRLDQGVLDFGGAA